MNPIPEIKVTNLVKALKYQEGAVVSKEVVRKPCGTVTVFAFDAGQGLSEHKTPFDAMIFVLTGQAEILIGGNMYVLNQGESIVLPANIPHAVKALKKFKMVLIMLRSQNC